MKSPILPGATLGVLGSGQLGRMFALAARQMGYRVHTFSPDSDTPSGQVSDVETKASYTDLKAVREFAQSVQVVTFEFENIPLETTDAAAAHAPVHPSGQVLHTTQNRLREKTFLKDHKFPVTPFAHIRSGHDLEAARRVLGKKAVLKTAGFGYDGKGQRVVQSMKEAQDAFDQLGGQACILEAWVTYETELSVIAARSQDGSIVVYDVFQNVHSHHILDYTVCPADLSPSTQKKAKAIACSVLESLDVVGVMCVEMFLTTKGELLVNELAPRPHNSGHLTIDACVTSQFEQQVRAVCGLPLGSPALIRPAAMANLMGELWNSGTPKWDKALSDPAVRLHLYGKGEARPGRKMGHVTILADTPAKAKAAVLKARGRL